MANFVQADEKILYIQQDGDLLPVACLDNNSFSESSDEIDTTTRDNNGWKTSLPTNQSYEISFSGLVENNPTDSSKTTFFDVFSFKRSRTLVYWQDGLTGNYNFGQGYITEVTEESPASDLISFSATLKGFGKAKNVLNLIYENWKTELLEETSGVVSSRKCVLNNLKNII